MRFIEARTPHEARPLKIAHGSDALCRDAQLSRTPPSDRRVCGAAPLVLGRLRLLADRRSVPQFASPSDRIHRDSVAGLFGSAKATSPYPGSTRRSRETDSPYPGRDSTEPRNGLDGAGKRTRRAREANSREPGSELDGAGERTRRSPGADATSRGADSSCLRDPARGRPARRHLAPNGHRSPGAAVALQNLPFRPTPADRGMWCTWGVRQMPRLGDRRSIGNLCMVCGPGTPTPHHPPPAPPAAPAPSGPCPLAPPAPLTPPAPPAPPDPPDPPDHPAGKFHHSSDASPEIPDFSPVTGVIRR